MFAYLKQTLTYLGRENPNQDKTSISLAYRQVCVTFLPLMNNVERPSQLGEVPLMYR